MDVQYVLQELYWNRISCVPYTEKLSFLGLRVHYIIGGLDHCIALIGSSIYNITIIDGYR